MIQNVEDCILTKDHSAMYVKPKQGALKWEGHSVWKSCVSAQHRKRLLLNKGKCPLGKGQRTTVMWKKKKEQQMNRSVAKETKIKD